MKMVHALAYVGMFEGESLAKRVNLGSTTSKLAVIALQVFMAVSARTLYCALPQAGLGFIATKFLQASLTPTLVYGDRVLNQAWNEHFQIMRHVENVIFSLAIPLIGIPAACLGVPFVTTTGVLCTAKNFYDLACFLSKTKTEKNLDWFRREQEILQEKLFLQLGKEQSLGHFSSNSTLEEMWGALQTATKSLEQFMGFSYHVTGKMRLVSKRAEKTHFVHCPPFKGHLVVIRTKDRYSFWKSIDKYGIESIIDLNGLASSAEFYPDKFDEDGDSEVFEFRGRTIYRRRLAPSDLQEVQHDVYGLNAFGKVRLVKKIQYCASFSNVSFESGVDRLVTELQKNECADTVFSIHSGENPERTHVLIAAYFLKKSIVNSLITSTNLHSGLASLVLSCRMREGEQFIKTPEQFQILLNYGQFLLAKRLA